MSSQQTAEGGARQRGSLSAQLRRLSAATQSVKAAAPEMNQPTRWLFAEDGPPPGKPLDHTVARNLSEASSIVAAGAKDLARTAAHVRSIAHEGGAKAMNDAAAHWLFNEGQEQPQEQALPPKPAAAAPPSHSAATAVHEDENATTPTDDVGSSFVHVVGHIPGAIVHARVSSIERKRGRKPSTDPVGATSPRSPATGFITVFVVDVTVTAPVSAGGTPQTRMWRLRKRYNDFKALHAACVEEHLGDELPLPQKSKGAQTDEMLNARQVALNAYLEDLCGRRELPTVLARELQQWLSCEDNGFGADALLWPSADT